MTPKELSELIGLGEYAICYRCGTQLTEKMGWFYCVNQVPLCKKCELILQYRMKSKVDR